MRKRINTYISYIDKILNHELPVGSAFDIDSNYSLISAKDVAPTRKEYEKLLERHLEQIAFFQHERLVHLLVVIVFAIMTFLTFGLCIFVQQLSIYILLIALLILLVPYIMHYYLLENGVQKMYRQYDEIVKRML